MSESQLPVPRPSFSSAHRGVAEWVRDAGIIAHLPTGLGRQLLIEVADALLAAPVLMAIVPFGQMQAAAAITALCERAGPHMLVGASDIRTTSAAVDAIAAGARCLLASHLDRTVAKQAQACGVLYLPGVLTQTEAREAAGHGLTVQVALSADLFGPEHIHELCAAAPGCEFLALGDIDHEQTGAYARAGATALVVDVNVSEAGVWRQADLISEMRSWQAVWAEVRA